MSLLLNLIGCALTINYDFNRFSGAYVNNWQPHFEVFKVECKTMFLLVLLNSNCGSHPVDLQRTVILDNVVVEEPKKIYLQWLPGPRQQLYCSEWGNDVENVLKSDRDPKGRLPIAELDAFTPKRHLKCQAGLSDCQM